MKTKKPDSPVKLRLREFIAYKGISQRQFSSLTKVSSSYVTNISDSISQDVLASISQQFPDLSTGWLMSGEGTMIKGELPPPPPEPGETAAPTERTDTLAIGRREWGLIEMQYKLLESQSNQMSAVIRSLNRRDKQMEDLIDLLRSQTGLTTYRAAETPPPDYAK